MESSVVKKGLTPADWLCAGKYCNLSARKSSRAIIQKKGDVKLLVNALAALAEKKLPVVFFFIKKRC